MTATNQRDSRDRRDSSSASPLETERSAPSLGYPDGVRESMRESALTTTQLRHNAILAQLAGAWQRAPHLPLGQVVESIAAHARTDVWGMTDDELYLAARTWTGAIVPQGEDQ